MVKTIIKLSIFSAMLISQNLDAEQLPKEYLESAELESVKVLPIKSLKQLKYKDGVTVYVSGNGRYKFNGEFIDLWLGSDVEAVDQYQSRTFDGTGIDPNKISIEVTNGKEIKYLFIAPECLECKQLVTSLVNNPKINKKYNIKAILLSSSSFGFDMNTAIWCSKDKKKRLVNVFGGKNPVDNNNNQNCNQLSVMTGNTVGEAFRISKLPAVMSENGMVNAGKSELLINILENN